MNKLLDRDLLSALVLFVVGTVSLYEAGTDVRNWIFPRLATYLILAIAAALAARVVFSALVKRVPDLVDLMQEDRIVYFDVLVFLMIVLAYMFVMYGLGFWLSSLIMLWLTSLYLTLEKTRANIGLALVVPLVACVVAYFVFLHVFYVPFPKAIWWPGVG